MGRLAVIADLHVGPRGAPFGRIVEDRLMLSIRDLLKFLKEQLVAEVIFAGDTFDRVLVPPRFVREFKEILREYWLNGMRFTFITGNHEFDIHDGNALDFLPELMCECVSKPGIILGATHTNDNPMYMLTVPYVYGWSAEDVILEALTILSEQESKGMPLSKVMVGHFGIYDDDAPPWKVADKQAVSCKWLVDKLKVTSIEVVVVGHHHTDLYTTRLGMTICQVGALAPRSFSDSGLGYGNVVIIDKGVNCTLWRGYVSGVRFITEDCSDTFRIPEYTINTSWYVTKFGSFGGDCEVVNDPKSLSDVKNGVVTYVDQSEKRHVEDIERSVVGFSRVEEVVCNFVENDSELCAKHGLLSEAVSRVKGCSETEERYGPVLSNVRLRKMVK